MVNGDSLREMRSLHTLFAPRSIAVVGASSNPRRIGGRAFLNLKRTFTGSLYAVNTRGGSVHDTDAYTEVAGLPEVPDLAVVAVPVRGVLTAIQECAEAGVAGAVILTSGLAEVGDSGAATQRAMVSAAGEKGMRLLGPNCVGYLNLTDQVLASFLNLEGRELLPGGLGIVSQSGAMGAMLFEEAQRAGIGVGSLITTGNESDITAGAAIQHLIDRPEITTILAFLEGVRDGDSLVDAFRLASSVGKPIIAMKVGQSSVGSAAAQSHTGALATPAGILRGIFHQYSVTEVASIREMLDFAVVFQGGRSPRGNRLAIAAQSGGMGVLASDVADRVGLKVPSTSESTRAAIEPLIPWFASARNPIDWTAQMAAEPENLHRVLTTLVDVDDFDMLAVLGTPLTNWEPLRDGVAAAAQRTDKPIVVFADQPELVGRFAATGVPTLRDSGFVIAALGALYTYSSRVIASPQIAEIHAPTVESRARTLTEDEAKSVLNDHGVETPRRVKLTFESDLSGALHEVGTPAVAKISSACLAHKSDVGGVRLGLATDRDVRSAFDSFQEIFVSAGREVAELEVLLEEQVPGGIELVVGALRDAVFGAVVSVGFGGVLVEIVDEQQYLKVPVAREEASAALRRLFGGRLVSHARGLGDRQEAMVVNTIMTVANLMETEPAIVEIDINPLIVVGDHAVAVDALIRTETINGSES